MEPTVITCCSHDNKAAHMIGDHVHRLVHHWAGRMWCAELCRLTFEIIR